LSLRDLLFYLLVIVLFVIVPSIPGMLYWCILTPVAYWEKFAWLCLSVVSYIVAFGIVFVLAR